MLPHASQAIFCWNYIALNAKAEINLDGLLRA